MKFVCRFWTVLTWLYTGLLISWWLLQQWLGDWLWWLALLNTIAPALFFPLLVLWPVDWLVQRRHNWWPLACPLLLFLGLYGALFMPSWPGQLASADSTLSVMTLNMWGGSYHQQSTQVFGHNGWPDIVAIQEVSPFMMSLLLPALTPHYPYHRLDGRGTGMGVFSRYPLTPLTANFTLQPGWQLQVVRIQVAQRSLLLYNFHPQSTNVFLLLANRQLGSQEIAKSFYLRQLFAEKLLADIQTRTEPVLVVGDFNSPPNSDLHKLLLTRLDDAHLQGGWGFGHTFPAHGSQLQKQLLLPRLTRLDMILYSHELVAQQTDVGLPTGESDHLPVLATLAWRH